MFPMQPCYPQMRFPTISKNWKKFLMIADTKLDISIQHLIQKRPGILKRLLSTRIMMRTRAVFGPFGLANHQPNMLNQKLNQYPFYKVSKTSSSSIVIPANPAVEKSILNKNIFKLYQRVLNKITLHQRCWFLSGDACYPVPIWFRTFYQPCPSIE